MHDPMKKSAGVSQAANNNLEDVVLIACVVAYEPAHGTPRGEPEREGRLNEGAGLGGVDSLIVVCLDSVRSSARAEIYHTARRPCRALLKEEYQ